MQKPTYHHGNLKAALLSVALDHVRQYGADKISLRALARDLGVSQTAPYRHFADKDALLAELAAEGFNLLAQALQPATQTAQHDPVSAMEQAGASYVKFALTHPEHYRLMFGSAHFHDRCFPGLDRTTEQSYDAILQIIEAGISQGVFRAAATELLALSAWSTVHGLASLLIDELIDQSRVEDNEQLIKAIANTLMQGILTPPT
ncbi:TetR/AcrR family transcriptional regulator [Zooshikella harenae]|uniref:TetR/AcrR family transcriptional regulator n=1 Tax=Zooshikella harenae TaxID=2827238 RepID=A0ABS5ZEZ3_9GAMM|nr:TetR/AcrR family transcriptional regulator [Zooshikella harenae]MBU2712637.1 TetR/AcrR family transcriptional regulator [Zooshikella harenae]